ncbi:zinc finger RNA-binding protein-like [Dendrobium catenatum]|uniref:C2H2-type domain-containing protein n=1 Tax=Dendrobium catenatum TaxID=906689 RepID=A0A2I0X292_9ASPA|nr:zinc finger RNA-binding protein-like [Dendrobium catenatum]PKU82025.1 hypothetical protein MA16_Dca004042 [Dendrobium catenatum]
MDYGIHNSHHLYAAPQTLVQPHPQPQPRPPQAAAAHLYSAYYSTANPNPYPNPIVRHEDASSSSLVFADGGVAQAAEHYAVERGFDGQAMQYGAYQPHQPTDPYAYAQALAAASLQQAKRKLKIRSTIFNLEEKKQRIIEGGASADEVKVCTMCNVVCNSAKVFASHLAGEKHALKALGPNYRTLVPKVMAHLKQVKHAKKSVSNKRAGLGYIAAPKIVENFSCEVCKIECNSQETLNTHKMGRKHKANLLKLQEKITPKPSTSKKNISAGQDQSTNVEAVKKPSSIKEDLKTKKDKVVQGGAAEEAIMICALCDVVCNSKDVYDSHISGKKHLAMIKKQETQV